MWAMLFIGRFGLFQRLQCRSEAGHRFLFGALLLLCLGLGSGQAATQGGLIFDGADDYVTFGQAPGLSTYTFTLETWFKRTGTGVTTTSGSGGVTAVPLIAKGRGEGDGSNVDMNYFLGIRTTDNVLVADFEEGATGTTPGLNHPVAGVTPIAMSTWYHAAVTYNGTTWRLYLNGVLETELEVGQPCRGDSIQHAGLGTALTSTGAPQGYFAGVLDEVRIWNSARSGQEIADNKNTSIPSAPNLLGSWQLDEAGGITATDSSGNAVNGLLVNGPVFVNAPAPPPPVTYVAAGSTWKYLDDGSNAGTEWRNPGFDDSGWASGPAELGYGDGVEATVVSYGPNSNAKFITTYFRRSFTVADVGAVESLTMQLLRDDGAVIYLNGVEAARQNMPAGAITYTTVASAAVGGTDETAYFESSISPALLVEGENVLAVEIHQNAGTSTDISFDLELTAVRRTMTITLESPLAGAQNVNRPPTLRASVTHRSGAPMTAVVYGRVAPPPGGEDFSIAVLPDTQNYTASLNGGSPALLQSQVNWIRSKREEWNIVYVAQEGDLSNNGDQDPSQWQNATSFYGLTNALSGFQQGIPFGIAVGNHDQMVPTGDTEPTTYYNQFFGSQHYTPYSETVPGSYYGGHYGANNNNQYHLFSASGLDFIVIFFEYNVTSPAPGVLSWANSLLQTHNTRRGIVVSHSILNVASPATWTSPGANIYNALKANPNLFLLLCGHNSGEARREDIYNGNKVYSLLADYQGRANGGDTWMRLLKFSPNNNLIQVRTMRSDTGAFETDADSQFDLPYTMEAGGESFVVLATLENLASGSTISPNWSGLAPETTYEWYVTANDGTETATSPRRRFTTGPNLLPQVAISSPLNGASYVTPATITISANATDGDGTITKVEFQKDGVEFLTDTATPFESTLSGLVAGTYIITAVAYDNEGGITTSLPITVVVNEPANIPPVVCITSPVNGTILDRPLDLTIMVDASDPDGDAIAKVEFFAGQVKLGEASTPPYQFDWIDVPAGTHSTTAKATDSRGASTFSAPVTVTVRPPPALVRGPYLQLATPSSMRIRWQTDRPAESRLLYGENLTPGTPVEDATLKTDHAVSLTGLNPATPYQYQIGTEKGWFPRTGNEYFLTPPPTGTIQPTRIWVLGDSGGANAGATLVRDGFLTYAAGDLPDMMLMLGDNAFQNGMDPEYQAAVFNMYPALLPNTALWPTLGELDISAPSPIPYFNIFSLPTAAEAGGTASDTENYYSFNRANVHFICLDSVSSDRTSGGAMLDWLQSDLATNTQPWTVAYWHHPPYSKGSHDSDTEVASEDMRLHALPLLEAAGVDLVLSAHSRAYERSYLIKGHSGNADTFVQTMLVDGGDGTPGGTGAYQKPPTVLGTVYVVAGSGSETAGGSLNHPAMYLSADTLGSLVLDVNGDRMDVAFVGTDGNAVDQFTILKTPTATEAPTAPDLLTATTVSSGAIDLDWRDNATDEVGFKIESSIDNSTFSEVASLGANITSTRISGLHSGTKYYFRVRAYNTGASPDSAYSNAADATTDSLPAPTGLTAVPADGSIRLSWNPVPNECQYKVKRSTTSGTDYTELDWYGFQTFYIDSTVSNGTTYYYVVIASINGQPSPHSPEASATAGAVPPAAPTGLHADPVSTDQVTLGWTDNSGNEAGFEIQRSEDGVNYTIVASLGANAISHTDGSLNSGTYYHYRVRATNPYGTAAADSISVKTLGPRADSQSVTTAEDVPLEITLTGDEGDVFVDLPVHGSLTGGSSNWLYTPYSNYNGPDSFSFVIISSQGQSTPATVSITVTPVNDPPVAVAQQLTLAEDSSASFQLQATDVDGTIQSYRVVTGPTLGILDGTAPNLTYTPAANSHGTDSFTFVAIDDGALESLPATVSIIVQSVNDAPVAVDDAVVLGEDGNVSISVLANDTDPDFDSLTITAIGNPANGSAAFESGQIVYTVGTSFTGSDSFAYTVSDGHGGNATAWVHVSDTTAPVTAHCAADRQLDAGSDCQAALPDLREDVVATDNGTASDALVITQIPGGGTTLALGATVVAFTIRDAAGNEAACSATVTVRDITPPVVTLKDAQTMTVERGEQFSDPGATTSDNCSGAVQLTTTGSVDPNTVGDYTLSYTATDLAQNTGTASRTVKVTDTIFPTITVAPASEVTMTTARISWTTDEPANSTVDYGVTSTTKIQVTDPTMNTSHVLNLTGLTPGTTYQYDVKSTDGGANTVMAPGLTFTTSAEATYKAYAIGDPVVSIGTIAGDYSATFLEDTLFQTITEASAAARLQADYTLHAEVTPAEVTALTLHTEATWTGLPNVDNLVVSIWNGTAWLDITSDIQDGAFTPSDNPKNYINTDGNILVRFTDSSAKKGEAKDTLAIDLLDADVTAGPPDTQPPVKPAIPSATVDYLNVSLAWIANTEADLAGYRVYRATGISGGDYQLLTSEILISPAYADATTAAGTYRYVVTAVDHTGNESTPSDVREVTTIQGEVPASPTGLTVGTISRTQIGLTWSDASTTETGFEIERSSNNVSFTQVSTVPANSTSFINTGLSPNTTYYYRVRAVNGAGTSAYSNTVSARTPRR